MTEEVYIDDDTSKVASRIELLERNLRYIQQQHEVTLIDLHNEINRLQQENKDLHYRLINANSSEQESKDTDKFLDEDRVYLEQKFDELEKQLIESEEKNIYLLQQIDELNKKLVSQPDVSPTNGIKTPVQTIDNKDYQHFLTITYEKQQEIAKLRSVLVEILNTERLSYASKVLLRNCLTSINDNEISMSKTTTTPVDMLFTMEKQQRQKFNGSPSTNGKTLSFRQSNSQQRANLPSIVQGNSSLLLQNPTYVNESFYDSLSPTTCSQNQRLIKIGETPIARRERRTQELQKNRLMKNLYH